MPRKTPPCEHYPAWTEARYRQFIRSGLRKLWQKWPPKFDCMNEGRRTVEGKRHKYEHQCNHCKEWFTAKQIQIDHIDPVGSDGDWNVFIERLLVGKDKLQKLCYDCHRIKTKEERDNARKGG